MKKFSNSTLMNSLICALCVVKRSDCGATRDQALLSREMERWQRVPLNSSGDLCEARVALAPGFAPERDLPGHARLNKTAAGLPRRQSLARERRETRAWGKPDVEAAPVGLVR